eukprot:3684-Hanusia_phi.AAC.1
MSSHAAWKLRTHFSGAEEFAGQKENWDSLIASLTNLPRSLTNFRNSCTGLSSVFIVQNPEVIFASGLSLLLSASVHLVGCSFYAPTSNSIGEHCLRTYSRYARLDSKRSERRVQEGQPKAGEEEERRERRKRGERGSPQSAQ